MQRTCLDYMGTKHGATVEVTVKMFSTLRERGKQLHFILKTSNGKAKEIQKWKKEKIKFKAEVLGIERYLRNKFFANTKYLSLHLLSS